MTLVGVVNADIGLHIPDFRAAESGRFSFYRRWPAGPGADRQWRPGAGTDVTIRSIHDRFGREA